jgi:hypothetical protein
MKAPAKHIVMRFEQPGIQRAYEMASHIDRYGIPAEVNYINGRWQVTTDTRVLDHAAELVKYIGGAR